MSKILKNTTSSPILVKSIGQIIAAFSQGIVPPDDYDNLSQDTALVALVDSGSIVVNDGNSDLSATYGKQVIKVGIYLENLSGTNATFDGRRKFSLSSTGLLIDSFDFGASADIGDSFLNTGSTNHTSKDSSFLAMRDGSIVAITVSTEENPERIFDIHAVKNAFKGKGPSELQKIAFNTVPTSGSWKLDFGGQITGSLAFNITAIDLKTAMKLLPNLPDLTVSGDFTNGFSILFDKSTLSGTNIAELIINTNTLLTSGTPVNINVSTLENGGIYSGGYRIGAILTKQAGILDRIYENLSGYTFKKGDRIQCYIAKNPDPAKEPAIRFYVKYDTGFGGV